MRAPARPDSDIRAARLGPGIRRQRGIVLIFTLIALVLLTIGAVALIRSTDSATVIAANMGFKRDLTNQGEFAVALTKSYFLAGGALNSDAVRQNNLTSVNYSATILESDSHGIPKALLNSGTASYPSYGGFTGAAADITGGSVGTGVTIRYVIDRLCDRTGLWTPTHCVVFSGSIDRSGTAWLQKAGAGSPPVYRLSMRVSGPRNTQAFFQTTLTTR